MAISDRKLREKEDLKKRILEAAKALFLEKGFEATSMRNIAERVEFSPTTLYLYYKDKNDIVFALHQEGFKLLAQQFSIVSNVEHPYERLKTMGRIYLKFAEENPDFYELMFVRQGPIIHVQKYNGDDWQEGSRTYNVLYETVIACQKEGYFKDLLPHSVSLIIWSTLHGMCTLHMHMRLDCVTFEDDYEVDPEKSRTDFIYETFISFIERLK
ncbi:MAG: TetR/AcrR family transcriptional regulator [Dyadobacter sp.]